MNIPSLPQFHNIEFDQTTIESNLRNDAISIVEFYVLGCEGTNISQSAMLWAKKIGISNKSRYIYCDTPEESIEKARKVQDTAIFPLFVTCAVYYDLSTIYFSNPDCYVLLHHHYMKLDNMQLAAREYVTEIPSQWVIASHPSPKGLSTLKNKVVSANSNSYAAKACYEGLADACITTEAARRKYGLIKLHDFGSPMMLFLYGTTPHGISILRDRKKEEEVVCMSDINLDKKTFVIVKNDGVGAQLGPGSIFHFWQNDDKISADYMGTKVVKGHLEETVRQLSFA